MKKRGGGASVYETDHTYFILFSYVGVIWFLACHYLGGALRRRFIHHGRGYDADG